MPLSELSFSGKPTHPLATLPEGVERLWIPTPSGKLEILYAAPQGTDRSGATPLYFAHGGMGCAYVWVFYMLFLAQRGIPCYAISYRGHGNSWHPSHLRMVFFTWKSDLADDLVRGADWVRKREGKGIVLVGHSSGGGLSQYVLDQGLLKVEALVLISSVAGSGSFQTYFQWFKQDPWFSLRMYAHLMHPNSPLSSNTLVKRIFFLPTSPDAKVTEFRKHMAPYEAFWWPLTMMYRFVDYKKVLLSIRGWEKRGSDRMMVMAGQIDVIMPIWLMRKIAEGYRAAMKALVSDKKVDKGVDAEASLGGQASNEFGIRHTIVPGHNHHTQNEEDWWLGAEKLLSFYDQL